MYEVEDNSEVFRLRWQVLRDLCAMANIGKDPFSWTEIFSSTKIASINCDSLEQKPLCSNHSVCVPLCMLARLECSAMCV